MPPTLFMPPTPTPGYSISGGLRSMDITPEGGPFQPVSTTLHTLIHTWDGDLRNNPIRTAFMAPLHASLAGTGGLTPVQETELQEYIALWYLRVWVPHWLDFTPGLSSYATALRGRDDGRFVFVIHEISYSAARILAFQRAKTPDLPSSISDTRDLLATAAHCHRQSVDLDVDHTMYAAGGKALCTASGQSGYSRSVYPAMGAAANALRVSVMPGNECEVPSDIVTKIQSLTADMIIDRCSWAKQIAG